MKIDPTELVSIKQAADIRGVTIQAIQHLIRQGRFTIIEIAEKKFLLRKEVESFVPDVGGRPRKDSAKKKHSS